MKNETKLLSCPFCGGEHIIESCNEFVPCLKCLGCGSIMTVSMDFKGNYKKELIKKWNTRKPMERILERLEECKETHDRRLLSKKETASFKIKELQFSGCYQNAIEIVKEEGGIE